MTDPSLDHIHIFQPAATPGLPTLLVLHGTGGNEHDLVPFGQALLPGAAILSPRGKILERGMPRFFRRFAEGVFDFDDLRQRAGELADFVEAAARHYAFDPNHVIGAGFSNGANIAATVLLLRPKLLRAALLYSPMIGIVPDPLPSLDAVPVLISAGKRDPVVAGGDTQKLADLLTACRAKVTMRWTEEGHTLTESDLYAGVEWLSKVTVSSGAASES